MKWLNLLFLSFSLSASVSAQSHSNLIFEMYYGDELLELNKNYYISTINDSVKIDNFKCYISNIVAINDKGQRKSLSEKYHLLNAESSSSQLISIEKKQNIKNIQFDIGIDSITNTNAVMTGDLDPINGMYWTWQSGFINWKIEGSSPILQTRNHYFKYHIGGFLPPFSAIQTVILNIKEPSDTIFIKIDLKPFFEKVDIKKTNEIMSPSAKAVELSYLFSTIFSVKNEME